MEGAGNRRLPVDAQPLFQEGIWLVLSGWTALHLAVDNEWGGRESRRRPEILCSDIFMWFTQNKEPLYIDDLESILDEAMLSLNTEVDDGSIEEIAEKLIVMHEECLDGDFRSIENLRQPHPPQITRSHLSRQVVNDDDDDDSSSDMMVDDAIECQSNSSSQPRPVNQPNPEAAAEAQDGWVQVTSRRSRNKRN